MQVAQEQREAIPGLVVVELWEGPSDLAKSLAIARHSALVHRAEVRRKLQAGTYGTCCHAELSRHFQQECRRVAGELIGSGC